NIRPGIKLIDEREGSGRAAEEGCQVTYNLRAFLSKGEEVMVTKTAMWRLTAQSRGTCAGAGRTHGY
ncbi:MAG TPA: hypothetical protein VKD04_10060, partial [Burkholderiales bacterium]|nr:hypothetical protein [Burkholderiales bacterium]